MIFWLMRRLIGMFGSTGVVASSPVNRVEFVLSACRRSEFVSSACRRGEFVLPACRRMEF